MNNCTLIEIGRRENEVFITILESQKFKMFFAYPIFMTKNNPLESIENLIKS